MIIDELARRVEEYRGASSARFSLGKSAKGNSWKRAIKFMHKGDLIC